MTLTVYAERWCECLANDGSIGNEPHRCGDVATSLCQCCGIPLCDSHEILCIRCSCPVCRNCEHVCQIDPERAELEVA
jgi:hypothetical protein